MRKLIGMLCSLCLTGCVFHGSTDTEPVVMGEQTRVCGSFNQIRIQGPFNVEVQTGFKQSSVQIKTFSKGLPYIRTTVHHGILRVSCAQNCTNYGHIALRIRTRQLQSLWYSGQGDIRGSHLNAPALNLYIKNPGTTVLGGKLGLRRVVVSGGGQVTLTGVQSSSLDLTIKQKSKVQMAGQIRIGKLTLEDGSWVSLYWVKANQLKLRVHGKTVIQMAGMAKLIDVELWDQAEFRGRYLKADETYVKTHDHAIAEITTLKHQHTLASDSSDIYLYRVPDSKANYMAYDGSVLDMRLFNPKLKYDPYNAYNL